MLLGGVLVGGRVTLVGKAMKEWCGLRRILGDSGSERTSNLRKIYQQHPTTYWSHLHILPVVYYCRAIGHSYEMMHLDWKPFSLSLASFRPWPELRWHGSRYNACRIPWGNACNGSPCPFAEKNGWGWRGRKGWTPTGLRMCQGQCSLARECWIGAILEEAPLAPQWKAH